MLLPTILDIASDQPFGQTQPCPFCGAPVAIQRWVSTVYDDPANPDDEHADHVSHRVMVHGETPLICFPVRRPGGAHQPYPGDWTAITESLGATHTSGKPS
jgi:hypothetical protein